MYDWDANTEVVLLADLRVQIAKKKRLVPNKSARFFITIFWMVLDKWGTTKKEGYMTKH